LRRPRQGKADVFQRGVLSRSRLQGQDEITNRSTRNNAFRAPKDAGMAAIVQTPLGIKRLIIGTIERDQHPPLSCGEGELVLITDRLPGAFDFMDGHDVKTQPPCPNSHGRRQILVKHEAQGHEAWFNATRASISSGKRSKYRNAVRRVDSSR
jgi:hypothetical protein